jgi:phosphopentomutase
MPFDRAIVIVLDGAGIGALPDAAAYGDTGSNTIGHVARQVALRVPTLRMLGLDRVVSLGPPASTSARHASFGRMAERSAGKDSVTGHWEISGIVLDRPFPVFPHGFPPHVLSELTRLTGRGILGNTVASGTRIIDELGGAHLDTGSVIVYTSADSVFQIAAHEGVVPVTELYQICEVAYRLVGEGLGVGRVIARPFTGEPGHFTRTANRRDFALPPRGETLLDRLTAAGRRVIAIGKIDDLFAGRGITTAYHTASDAEGMDRLERCMASVDDGLLFTNLVDFDTVYGHRNDVVGYAENLERFDSRLASVLPQLRPDDLLVVTADHGNDPTTPSTDHSREYVPLLVVGDKVRAGVDLGTRATFADLGQTIAEALGVSPLVHGTSFLADVSAAPASHASAHV